MSKHPEHDKEDASTGDGATRFYMTAKAAVFGPDGRVLLLTRSEGSRRGAGKLDLPGGHVDPDETIETTIRREIREETGLSVTDLFPLPAYFHSVADDGTEIQKLRFVAWTDGTDVTTDPDEHSGFEWLTPDEAVAKLSDEGYESDKRETIVLAKAHLEQRNALDSWKRCLADFDNYRKRQDASQKEMGRYLVERLVLDLVPVLDNFHAASAHVPEEAKDSPWVTGIGYIGKQFEDTLVQNGVTLIEPVAGEAFDPTKHEAMGTVEAEGEEVETDGVQKIAAVLRKGYALGDKVIRAAQVTVGA